MSKNKSNTIKGSNEDDLLIGTELADAIEKNNSVGRADQRWKGAVL